MSMFEESKMIRKDREQQVLRKMYFIDVYRIQTQQRMQNNQEKASQCLKFRPIQKNCK